MINGKALRGMQHEPTQKALSFEVTRIVRATPCLGLDKRPPPNVYYSVTLCVIDAVYSMGVQYAQVVNVVHNYCLKYGVRKQRLREKRIAPRRCQDSTDDLLERIREQGSRWFASHVFENMGRTSPKNGILKAQAVRKFAEVLSRYGVQHLQDLRQVVKNDDFEKDIRRIPGQRAGVSLQYFFMLAGNDDLIKPDRMIHRFMKRTLGRKVSNEECQLLLSETAARLKPKFPHMTPRWLDDLIWQHERRRHTGNEVHGRPVTLLSNRGGGQEPS